MDIAYIAGLFDGEGSLYHFKREYRPEKKKNTKAKVIVRLIVYDYAYGDWR